MGRKRKKTKFTNPIFIFNLVSSMEHFAMVGDHILDLDLDFKYFIAVDVI